MGLQNYNPFGQNFAPFEMPDNAPIRKLIGQKTQAERNAAPQSDNPFAPNFQPFYVPDKAPVRQVIGPRPASTNPVSPTGGGMGGLPSDYKATEASAFASAARHRGQMADIRGGGGDTSSGRKPLPRQILPTEEVRKNENGVVSTGKNLSGGAASDFAMSGGVSAAFVPEYANSSFNDLLAAQGNQRYQPYSSNQLPTTASNPFESTAPKTDGFDSAAPGITGATYDNYGAVGGAAAASSTDKSEFTPMSGKESRIEGGSDRRAGGSLADALNDKAGINSYMSKFSSGDRQRAASSAFLNAEDSLSGLQARDAVNDVVYAGGQHYGRDGDGTFKLDRADARQVASGKAKAQDFLQAKIDTTIDTQKQTPAEAQDPISAAGSAVKSGFAAGAQTDFALNNKQSTPSAGVGPVVPTDQIPEDLSGEAGKKYLADLDAGRLFK